MDYRVNGGSSKTSCFGTTSSADYGALSVRSEPRKLPTPPRRGAGFLAPSTGRPRRSPSKGRAARGSTGRDAVSSF
jgi:hypothetical protein